MTDLIHFAAAVLLALLFAAFQLGGVQATQGGKLTQAPFAPAGAVALSSL